MNFREPERQDVENRSVHLPLGWIALHTGKARGFRSGRCVVLISFVIRAVSFWDFGFRVVYDSLRPEL